MTDIDRLLVSLEQQDITTPQLERCLGLPMGTVEQWRTATPAEALVLLRMIKTFPWLLNVADYNYDLAVSRYIMVERAARLIATHTQDTPGTSTSATGHPRDSVP